MSDIILDSSAVLALLQQEKGHKEVERVLLAGACAICAVNLSEVITKLVDNGMGFSDACQAARLPNLSAKPFDTVLAQLAASLRPMTKSLGLSLGDRACLALGMTSEKASVYTADVIWKNLSIPNVTVHVVR